MPPGSGVIFPLASDPSVTLARATPVPPPFPAGELPVSTARSREIGSHEPGRWRPSSLSPPRLHASFSSPRTPAGASCASSSGPKGPSSSQLGPSGPGHDPTHRQGLKARVIQIETSRVLDRVFGPPVLFAAFSRAVGPGWFVPHLWPREEKRERPTHSKTHRDQPGRLHFRPHHHQSNTARTRTRTTAITVTAFLEDVSGGLAPGGGEVRVSTGSG